MVLAKLGFPPFGSSSNVRTKRHLARTRYILVIGDAAPCKRSHLCRICPFPPRMGRLQAPFGHHADPRKTRMNPRKRGLERVMGLEPTTFCLGTLKREMSADVRTCQKAHEIKGNAVSAWAGSNQRSDASLGKQSHLCRIPTTVG